MNHEDKIAAVMETLNVSGPFNKQAHLWAHCTNVTEYKSGFLAGSISEFDVFDVEGGQSHQYSISMHVDYETLLRHDDKAEDYITGPTVIKDSRAVAEADYFLPRPLWHP